MRQAPRGRSGVTIISGIVEEPFEAQTELTSRSCATVVPHCEDAWWKMKWNCC
jgi:hypothetical protein